MAVAVEEYVDSVARRLAVMDMSVSEASALGSPVIERIYREAVEMDDCIFRDRAKEERCKKCECDEHDPCPRDYACDHTCNECQKD